MILNGKEISKIIKGRVKQEVSELPTKVKLLVFLVGNNEASKVYVSNKERACKEVGIISQTVLLDEFVTQRELILKIKEANSNPEINGILVQLPLPSHLDEKAVINAIDPIKDVDGLTIHNQGCLFNGLKTIKPATPYGVMHLLSEYKIDVAGKNALVIGRSNLVGKPLAMLLLEKNATVTIAHSKTKNLKDIAKRSDIIISCVGKPFFVTADMIKPDTIVIDVGISRFHGKIVGDVDFPEVEKVALYITPVPGGVGPMTIATLMENVVECYKIQNHCDLN